MANLRVTKNGVTTEKTHAQYMSACSETSFEIRIDYPKIQQWPGYEQIVSFPLNLYIALNSFVTGALQKCFAESPAIDEEEPFGALMVFQRNVVWRLVLQCISAFPQINKELILIEQGSIQS